MYKKLLVSLSILAITTPASFAAYPIVDCNSDTDFTANSCNQCFDGGTKLQGDHIGLLSDLWVNAGDTKQIFYKEEQSNPEMINLNSSNVSWTQTPSSEGFWNYTDEFNALNSETEGGYILDAGKSVTWIKSGTSSAYKLEKNTANADTNIGLLVYPISTHNIKADGEITLDAIEHKECVLFKSGEAATTPVTPGEKPKKLPDTGPTDFLLLALLAMILGFGVLKFRTKS